LDKRPQNATGSKSQNVLANQEQPHLALEVNTMRVYVVFYDEVTRGREGPETDRHIAGVYDSIEKAVEKVRKLSAYHVYSYVDYESFEIE
jgi:hypothetical protein